MVSNPLNLNLYSNMEVVSTITALTIVVHETGSVLGKNSWA